MGLQKRIPARGRLAARSEEGSAVERGAEDASKLELGRAFGDPDQRPQAFLVAGFEFEPREWLRRMPGRETFALGERLVVKRYVGDDWREWWHERRRGGEHRSPARREAENLASLAELGIRVPRPIAWCEEPGSAPWFSARGGRSLLAMERLPHPLHLRRTLADADTAATRAWTLPLAKFVAQLHREHWFHRDLY
ncbi:MAG TPA: lipopolysaccharide kinase InaA family protein, partial [Planctomycetota bacterium]|nr:lipopolysaccharide kinase InaA family protein [Planctomycetota bacterium]